MLPNFLIIGAPRAGTTWIAKNIGEHPDIYMPKDKEMHFFDRHYDKGIEHYETFFPDTTTCTAVGEATPEYLYMPDMPARIKQHLPDVKLIASLRNPTDRVYSRFWHAKARFAENKDVSFEEKIAAKPVFLEEGFYYDHLMRYLELYPRENLLVLLFEEIKTDPLGFLKKVYEFLEVDTDFKPPVADQKVNSAAIKGSLAKSRMLGYVYKGLMSMNIAAPAKFIERINEGTIPEMNPETRKHLVNEVYREKNLQLAELIGQDLSAWNRID